MPNVCKTCKPCWRSSAGFTLVEMIITIIVMAILAGITASPVYQFIKQRDIQQELNIQADIRKAFVAYVNENKIAPTDNAWYSLISRYTNLSPNQIRFDVWGNERRYIQYSYSETMLGIQIPIFYATVISAGPDNKADKATDIQIVGDGSFTYNKSLGGSLGGYAAHNGGSWWKDKPNSAAVVNAFSSLEPGDDDLLLRLTDYPQKLAAYEQTLERLSRVSTALDAYAKDKYAQAVLNDYTACSSPATPCATSPADFIYFPPSSLSGNTPNYYDDAVKADVASQLGAGNMMLTINTNNETRRNNMIALMRIVGLPDNYCCSAMSGFVDSTGVRREMPFYYASNPRPRVGSACGTRPNPTSTVTLPPRVSVVAPNTTTCY